MKDLESLLEPGEAVLWRGRPAPRAFTFRTFRRTIAVLTGLLGLLGASRIGGEGVFPAQLLSPWSPWLSVLLAVGLWFCVGQLLWARLEWERVFYMLTNNRLLAVHGILGRRRWALPLEQLRRIEPKPLGGTLATLHIVAESTTKTLYCLEHPEILMQLLQDKLAGDADLSSCNPRLTKPV